MNESAQKNSFDAHSAASVRRLDIWNAPLTDNERSIIEQVLKAGSGNDARRWLRHLLTIYDAREASRVEA